MYGAFLDYGVSPWQILQQTDGFAELTVGGRCICNPDLPEYAQGGRVGCCVREEDTNAVAVDWVWAEPADGQWSCKLRIPAGRSVPDRGHPHASLRQLQLSHAGRFGQAWWASATCL